MSLKSNSFLLQLLLGTIACIIVAMASGGFIYDGGSDVYTERLISGYITSVPEHFMFTFGFHLFTGYLLKWCYVLFPNFPWYDSWSLLLILFAYGLGALWLKAKLEKQYSWLILPLYSLLMFENIRYIEITKTAYFLSLFSLLHLLLPAKLLTKKSKLFFILSFTLGLFTRCEAGFLAILTSIPMVVSFSYPLNILGIKNMIQQYFLLAPILVFTVLVLNVPWTSEDELYLKIRPYQFTLWDFKEADNTYCAENSKDSTILFAAQNSFMADTKNMNADFFKKNCVIAKDKTLFSLQNYFRDSSQLVSKFSIGLSLQLHKYWSAFFFLLTVLVASAIPRNERKTIFVPLLIFSSYALILIISIAALMKTEDHVMLPLISTVWFAVIFLFFRKNQNAYLVACCFLFFEIFSLISLYDKIHQRELESNQMAVLEKEIELLPQNSIVCFDLYTLVKLHSKLFSKDRIQRTIEPYSFDNGFIYLCESWKAKTKKLFGSGDLEKVFNSNFVATNRDVYFVFMENRNKLFERYSRDVFRHELKFHSLPEFNSAATYRIYKL
jgi:hypothetical protein